MAKGLGILLVILGHSMEYEYWARNLVFSFHMPLFFILTGFTMKPAEDYSTFFVKLLKDALYLLGPYVLASVVAVVLTYFMAAEPSPELLERLIEHQRSAMFWGTGLSESLQDLPSIGMIWFLLAMFTGKLFVNLFHVIFRNSAYESAVFAMFALVGMEISKYWILPFNFDISMVCAFLIHLGVLYRQNEEIIERRHVPVLIVSLVIWTYFLAQGIHIEIAGRTYPFMFGSVLEAVCGSYVFVCFCRAITDSTQFLKTLLMMYGQDSLIILLLHYEDFVILDSIPLQDPIPKMTMRLLIIMVVGMVIIFIKRLVIYPFQRKRKKRRRQGRW